MADREPTLAAELRPAVSEIDPGLWDRLAGDGDPFVRHAFLALLEESESVGTFSGWRPSPIIATRDGATLGVLPAYLKAHSQGEYVFDHGWADAWERAGQRYYPKLQVAVPFTPCPGRRLLGEPDALLAVAEAVTAQNSLSSAHITFCLAEEVERARARGWLVRRGLQYHWFNRGYASFEDFLAALASRKRKAVRRERAAAVAGLDIVTLRGAEIEPAHWDAMWTFYQDTGARKWGRPYLSRAFFQRLGAVMGEACLLFLALDGGVPVAGALNFVGGDTLYGRYWGAVAERPFLHFELSYYRAMEWAIAHGLRTVQAGAQGEHKLARGYEPVETFSLHYLPDAGFRGAVADFLRREGAAIDAELDWARGALPYRSSE